MAFLEKVPSHRPPFLLFLNCVRVNQVGFKQVFDNLTVKHMDALKETDSVSSRLCFEPNVKNILRLIARYKLL